MVEREFLLIAESCLGKEFSLLLNELDTWLISRPACSHIFSFPSPSILAFKIYRKFTSDSPANSSNPIPCNGISYSRRVRHTSVHMIDPPGARVIKWSRAEIMTGADEPRSEAVLALRLLSANWPTIVVIRRSILHAPLKFCWAALNLCRGIFWQRPRC